MTIPTVAERGEVNLVPDPDVGPEPEGEPREESAGGPPSTTETEEEEEEEEGGTLQEGITALSSASETAPECTAAELSSATEREEEEEEKEGGASLLEDVAALCDVSETDPKHVAGGSSRKSKRKVKFFVSVILNTTGSVPKQIVNVSAYAVLHMQTADVLTSTASLFATLRVKVPNPA